MMRERRTERRGGEGRQANVQRVGETETDIYTKKRGRRKGTRRGRLQVKGQWFASIPRV
jgi:hypothetical protein